MENNLDQKHHYERFVSEQSMKWYGWGSPVGLTIFFLGISVTAILFRFAFLGFN